MKARLCTLGAQDNRIEEERSAIPSPSMRTTVHDNVAATTWMFYDGVDVVLSSVRLLHSLICVQTRISLTLNVGAVLETYTGELL